MFHCSFTICWNLRGTKNGFLTVFLTAFLTVRKILCLFCRWQPYFFVSVPRRPPPPDGAFGLRHPRFTPPASTLFPLLIFFFFFTLYPIFQFLFFFCTSLSVHLSFLFLFMRIFMCTYRLAFGTQRHQLPLTLFPCICLFVHSFFSSFVLYMLGCMFLYAWIPLHAHSFFMYTLAYIFNFTKCICLPDVVYFFVYIFMCVFCC